MKRFTTLALLAFALAAVPAALADGGTTAPAAPEAQQAPGTGAANARVRIEIVRLRLQIVALRFRLHCAEAGSASQGRCTAFARKAADRLTTLDGKVKAKLDALRACTAAGTDPMCKNAGRKIAVLAQIDTHLQAAIQRLQDWLAGKTPADSSSGSALDQAAGQLGQAAGATG